MFYRIANPDGSGAGIQTGTAAPGMTTATAYDWTVTYTGHKFDSETGLYYANRRYYSPNLGRWISRDPLEYIDGNRLYEYVGSEPVSMADYSGLWKVHKKDKKFYVEIEADDRLYIIAEQVLGKGKGGDWVLMFGFEEIWVDENGDDIVDDDELSYEFPNGAEFDPEKVGIGDKFEVDIEYNKYFEKYLKRLKTASKNNTKGKPIRNTPKSKTPLVQNLRLSNLQKNSRRKGLKMQRQS